MTEIATAWCARVCVTSLCRLRPGLVIATEKVCDVSVNDVTYNCFFVLFTSVRMNEDSDTESDRGETPRHPIFSVRCVLYAKTQFSFLYQGKGNTPSQDSRENAATRRTRPIPA